MLRCGQIPSCIAGLAILVFSLGESFTSAQPTGVLTSKSHSGQFVMTAAPPPRVDRKLLNSGTMLELDPTLLPIACERVKQHINRELQTGPAWQSRVYLELHPAIEGEPGVSVTCERYQNAWQYRLALPNPVDRTLFVKSIVQVLLLELANRANTGLNSAEVPTWLIEGFTRQILASRQQEIMLSPPTPGRNGIAFTPTIVSAQESPLKSTHETLIRSAPLSFEALSWPAPEQLVGPGAAVYGANAQLFLSRLLGVPGARERLKTMVVNLSASQNWQFAFFRAFAPEFQKALDVEKWWALQTVHFTGRELGQNWPFPESCEKVRDALRIPVNVYQSTNALPSRSEVTLQTALRQWQHDDQRRLIEHKARELEMLRLRVATNLVEIVENYRLELAAWLEDDTRGPVVFGLGRKAAQARASAHTAYRLDLLDQQFLQIEAAKQDSTP